MEIVSVFRSSNAVCPVFNDKHLSWSYDLAKEMVDTAQELGFPLMAGSSLPVTARLPSIDLPYGMEITEALTLGVGGPDGYDIHALEALQSIVERRAGAETGVAWIESYRGDEVWERLARGSFEAGGFDTSLLTACMCRSLTLMPDVGGDGYKGVNHRMPSFDELPGLVAANAKGANIVRATLLCICISDILSSRLPNALVSRGQYATVFSTSMVCAELSCSSMAWLAIFLSQCSQRHQERSPCRH